MFNLSPRGKSPAPPFVAQLAARCRVAGSAWLWPGRQDLLKFFSVLVLLLALLATQQLVLTHSYTHLGASPGEQLTAQRDQDNPPITLHSCALCAAASGLHLISPPPALALPVVVIATQTLAAAVSPAPTFSFPAAYLSRAPPVLLN
jgi:hypothetical protein